MTFVDRLNPIQVGPSKSIRGWFLKGRPNGSALVMLLVAISMMINDSQSFVLHNNCIPHHRTIMMRPVERRRRRSSPSSSLTMSSNKSTNHDDLLEKARLLREEAQAMEVNLRSAQSSKSQSMSPSSGLSDSATSARGKFDTISFKRLEDSIWTLSYRFSSQPQSKEEEDEQRDLTKIGERKQIIVPRTYYSGKVTIRFRGDGYSEQLLPTVDGKLVEQTPIKQQQDIRISKVWGWDQETSNEDNQEYVLFSMDVTLPESDPDLPKQTERFYFQARVEQDTGPNKGTIISLKDGTITVKKDVADATKGRWGLFNVAGILTQFRYVGDFIAKPSNGKS